MASLMERIRDAFGVHESAHPPMSDGQRSVAERQKRIEKRLEAIDIQVDVLRADQRDVQRSPR
jgi:hypothetical protein